MVKNKRCQSRSLRKLGLLVYLFALLSCRKQELVTGEKLTTPAFSAIVLNSSFDVVLTQDTSYSIRFEAAEVFFPSLKYEVIDSVLYVDADKAPRWRNPEAPKPKVYITSNLSLIHISEPTRPY